MHTIAGQYKKNEQWRKITYVGSGVAGKCYLAVDINTLKEFAVKKVRQHLIINVRVVYRLARVLCR